jgi:pseudoazurin
VRKLVSIFQFIFLTVFLSGSGFATPPGTNQEMRERLKPAGTLVRASKSDVEQEVVGQKTASQPLPKVELSSGSEHEIKMLNSGPGGTMIFEPAVIKISKGDTVHFKATDLAHNSVSIDGMVPGGAETWAGALSEEISVTLNTEGVYVYQCDPHVAMAMVGVIQVGDAVNMSEIKSAAEALKSNFALNGDRLDRYLEQL